MSEHLKQLLEIALERLGNITEEEMEAFHARQAVKCAERAELEEEWEVVGGASDYLKNKFPTE